ncbi:hypothetical protein Esti_004387 [Eimeria stiedai]
MRSRFVHPLLVSLLLLLLSAASCHVIFSPGAPAGAPQQGPGRHWGPLRAASQGAPVLAFVAPEDAKDEKETAEPLTANNLPEQQQQQQQERQQQQQQQQQQHEDLLRGGCSDGAAPSIQGAGGDPGLDLAAAGAAAAAAAADTNTASAAADPNTASAAAAEGGEELLLVESLFVTGSDILDPAAVSECSLEALRAHGAPRGRGFELTPAALAAACVQFKHQVQQLYAKQGYLLATVEKQQQQKQQQQKQQQQKQQQGVSVEFKAVEPVMGPVPLVVEFVSQDAQQQQQKQQQQQAAARGRTQPEVLRRFLKLEEGAPFRWDAWRWAALMQSGLFEEASAVAVLRADGKAQARVQLREKRHVAVSPGVAFDSSLNNSMAELAYKDINLGGLGWALKGSLRRTLGVSNQEGGPRRSSVAEISLSNETLRKPAGLSVSRLAVFDKTSFPSKPQSGAPIGAHLGATHEAMPAPIGARQSGAAWRVDMPLYGGGPPKEGPLGGLTAQQEGLKGSVEVEAYRHLSLYAEAEEAQGFDSRSGEVPHKGAGGPKEDVVEGPLRRRAGALWRRAVGALWGPRILALSEVSVHPKLATAPTGHDLVKTTVSLAAARRQTPDPRFLGSPFEVSVHLISRLGAFVPLTASAVSAATANAKGALWGPSSAQPFLAAPEASAAAAASAAAIATSEAAAAAARAKAGGPRGEDHSKGGGALGAPRWLPMGSGPPFSPAEWIRGAPVWLLSAFKALGEVATETLGERLPFAATAAAAAAHRLQQQQEGSGLGQATPAQPFARADFEGALSLTPYAFLGRQQKTRLGLGGSVEGPSKGFLRGLLRCVDLRGLCFESRLGAHFFIGPALLQQLLHAASSEELHAAAAADEGPPGEAPTLEAGGGPRGLERFAGGLATLRRQHPLILAGAYSLALPLVVRRQLFSGQEETSIPVLELVSFVDAALMPLSPVAVGPAIDKPRKSMQRPVYYYPAAPSEPLRAAAAADTETAAAEAAAAAADAAAAAAAADHGSVGEAAAAAAGAAHAAAAAAAKAGSAAAAATPWEATAGVALRFRPLLLGLSWNLKAPNEGGRFFVTLRHAM